MKYVIKITVILTQDTYNVCLSGYSRVQSFNKLKLFDKVRYIKKFRNSDSYYIAKGGYIVNINQENQMITINGNIWSFKGRISRIFFNEVQLFRKATNI